MKLFIDGENDGKDILATYIDEENSYARNGFPSCLPCNEAGEYFVSLDGETFQYVEKKDLWNYPLIRINQYYDEDYNYISEQGIGVLAFNINAEISDDTEIKLRKYFPSYLSEWEGTIQIIFRLKDFISHKASELTTEHLGRLVPRFEDKFDCKNTNELINPFCKGVKNYTLNPQGLKLGNISYESYDYQVSHVSAEQVTRGKENGGRAAAKVRGEKSQESMKKEIHALTALGEKPTKKKIAERTGLTWKTANKHWKTVMSEMESEERR